MSLVAAACLLAAACGASNARITDASTTTYVRRDTDRTRVVSPSVQVAGAIGESVRMRAAYGVDVWAGASIDVRTSASQAVHETRNQVDAEASYALPRATLGASYRGSFEPDYLSNGGVLTVHGRSTSGNTEVRVDVAASADVVGRAGDPWFAMPQRRGSIRVAWTQTLDTKSLLELATESTFVHGFQSSPYRFVAIGAPLCASTAPTCLQESAPDSRLRQSLSVRGRRAFGDQVSLGLAYRFYFDSWAIHSHSIESDLARLVGVHGTFELVYRYYTQRAASFYRETYDSISATDGYVTRDRKLSTFFTNALGIGYVHTFSRSGDAPTYVVGARATGTVFHYLDFVGLTRVYVVESTATFGVRLR